MLGEKYVLQKDDTTKDFEGVSSFVSKLLRNRGFENHADVEVFLHPKYDEHTYDPFLLKDMEKGVQRILEALERNQRIVIFSDYDTDGIPGGVILHDFFNKIHFQNFTNYIPHRNDEGFGLNKNAIQKFKEEGINLIITIDCGISDVQEVEFANSLGIDVIITDHHLPQEVMPSAYAIIDPHQKGCTYPFKDLCGAGVAYKLVQGLIAQGDFGLTEGWEKWLLDMVGIATIADMVPLVDENRVFAFYGLQVLRKSRRPGLQHLLRIARVEQKNVNEEDVGFTISPRLNAASRMDRPDDAFKLLSTTESKLGEVTALHLERINNERKGMVASIVKEVRKKIRRRENIGSVIVSGSTDWLPGLLGLACSSLAEEFSRPVFLWGRGKDKEGVVIKGSCRSDGNTHVLELMTRVPDGTFLSFGGHEFSGGFSISTEKIHELEELLCSSFDSLDNRIKNESKIFLDSELSLDELTWDLYNNIMKLSPFGVANQKPFFFFRDVLIHEVDHFGKGDAHLKLIFKNSKGVTIEGISFFKNSDNFSVSLEPEKKISLVAHIEKSNFGYTSKLRLRIVDCF
jgi:single-stranded-DNA-specific exonuclease